LQALNSAAERIEQKIAIEHARTRREVRTEVRRVGEAVARGNAVLESIHAHPHESVRLLGKTGAAVSAVLLVASLAMGVELVNPAFALFVFVSSGLFWLMAVADERERGRRR
jgi:hypothetical protein